MSIMDISTFSFALCPHFTDCAEGPSCSATERLIEDMAGYKIKLCMSRHHEACPVYMQSLQKVEYGSYCHLIVADPKQ